MELSTTTGRERKIMEDKIEERHLIRFVGRLWENMVFEPLPGWEMDYMTKTPREGDGSYRIELFGKDDQILVTFSPYIEFRFPLPPDIRGLRFMELDIYIPFHPDARRIVFRHDKIILYTAPIAEHAPIVRLTDIRIDEEQAKISWESEHPYPLVFGIMYVGGKGKVFPIAANIQERTFTIKLDTLPGSSEGKLAILATDGIRSTYVYTKPFKVESKHPIVLIQVPGHEQRFSANEPITLSGCALDDWGNSLSDNSLTWIVDENVVAEGVRSTLINSLDPGSHKIKLQYSISRKQKVTKMIIVYVCELTPQQEEFQKIISSVKLQEFGNELDMDKDEPLISD
jgi:hypothetical protein